MQNSYSILVQSLQWYLLHNNECPYYPVKNKHTYKSKYVLPCFRTEIYIEARVCYLRYPVSEHRYILIQATMLQAGLCCALRQGTFSLLSKSTRLILGTHLRWGVTCDGQVSHAGGRNNVHLLRIKETRHQGHMRLHGLEDLTLITRCNQQMWHYINWKQIGKVLTSCNSLSLRFLSIALMTSYQRFFYIYPFNLRSLSVFGTLSFPQGCFIYNNSTSVLHSYY